MEDQTMTVFIYNPTSGGVIRTDIVEVDAE